MQRYSGSEFLNIPYWEWLSFLIVFFHFQVDFYVDKNMIHIADTKVDRRYGDYFIRQILKFEEQNRALKQLKM